MSFFQRLNFFKGLFTTAEDWRNEQAYHIGKAKLHNKSFRTPGVVAGALDGMEIKVLETGVITVSRGHAIDGEGRDLYLANPVTLQPFLEKNGLRYIAIGYKEEPAERRTNPHNPEFSGDAIVREVPEVKITDQPPDNSLQLELGRFQWKGQKLTQQDIDVRQRPSVRPSLPVQFAVRVAHGTIPLGPDQDVSKLGGKKFRIGEPFANADEAAEAVYVANAYPSPGSGPAGSTRILSRIESSLNSDGKIEYNLYLTNTAAKEVTVTYEVYRLNVQLD